MVWVKIWKICPKMSNFSIFCPSGQKKSLAVGSESTRVRGGSASYLLRVKSKLRSGPISSIFIVIVVSWVLECWRWLGEGIFSRSLGFELWQTGWKLCMLTTTDTLLSPHLFVKTHLTYPYTASFWTLKPYGNYLKDF